MLTILITIVHVLVSLFLILVVLAQTGKGQDLASAFGGTGSQTAFGARGTATLLSKITAGAAILFMVTSLSLSYLKPVVGGDTVIPDTPAPAEASEPAAAEPAAGEDNAAPETDAAAEETPAEAAPEAEVPPPQP
ncbi:MAG: hypothetical protein BMS9Abin37_0050 [Acidobacteriota bacterium]|nr:MAG: hypothetical protein BMS9Abin37_0050 [Acidobacteriota bacterium]